MPLMLYNRLVQQLEPRKDNLTPAELRQFIAVFDNAFKAFKIVKDKFQMSNS